jgi:hypothetical protein
MEVASKFGEGARFTVLLPILKDSMHEKIGDSAAG